MIRFNCRECGKKFKVSDEGAGKRFSCSRCGHLVTATPGDDSSGSALPAVGGRHGELAGAGPLGVGGVAEVFAGTSRGLRWAVILLLGLCAVSLLLAILSRIVPAEDGFFGAAASWSDPLFLGSAVVLMAIIYGQATSCPSCHRWWAREKVDSEFVDRTVVEREGAPVMRSIYRNVYECRSCRHRWSLTDADEYEYREAESRRAKPDGGRGGH
jgi:hypothetical protein